MEKDQLNILWTNADPVTAELIEHQRENKEYFQIFFGTYHSCPI
jgi:hypothetical protein